MDFFCFIFVLFSEILRYTDSEKMQFSLHYFVGILMEIAREKFQRKANSAELETLEILILLDKRPSFW